MQVCARMWAWARRLEAWRVVGYDDVQAMPRLGGWNFGSRVLSFVPALVFSDIHPSTEDKHLIAPHSSRAFPPDSPPFDWLVDAVTVLPPELAL